MHDQLTTVAEIASTLKLNEQTLRNWIDAGKLPAVQSVSAASACGAQTSHMLTGEDSDGHQALSQRPPVTIWDGMAPTPRAPSIMAGLEYERTAMLELR